MCHVLARALESEGDESCLLAASASSRREIRRTLPMQPFRDSGQKPKPHGDSSRVCRLSHPVWGPRGRAGGGGVESGIATSRVSLSYTSKAHFLFATLSVRHRVGEGEPGVVESGVRCRTDGDDKEGKPPGGKGEGVLPVRELHNQGVC